MSDLLQSFNRLSAFYERGLHWEKVEELYERENEKSQATNLNTDGNENSSDENNPNTCISIIDFPIIRKALNNSDVLATLLEISSTIRSIRSDNSDCDSNVCCWEELLKVTCRHGYLSLIYGLAGLINLNKTCAKYIKLSLAAVNTYFLSLTLPGAKGFHIFDDDVTTHCLQVFSFIDRIQNEDIINILSKQEIVEIWVRITTYCDSLSLLLRYVHFKDNDAIRAEMLNKFTRILYMNFEKGYANQYAINLHQKCFEIYEELLHPHNGEPEETLTKIMNMTVVLHTFPSKPKNSSPDSIVSKVDCEHISDWFIKMIIKYPKHLTKVLKFYIEFIITNPFKSWKTEQIQRALDYAAKYDAALFTKCNESSVEFLHEAIYADEPLIRGRVVDLMGRIIQIESHVEWELFRHEVSNIPREIHLIQEMLISIKDVNNNVKLKAVQALNAAIMKGSSTTQKIIRECLRFAEFNDSNIKLPDEPRIRKNEIRFERPQPITANYSFAGHGIIELDFLHLPEYVYTYLLRNALSHIRRAGVQFLEEIVKINPSIIFNTHFVDETLNLVKEPVALVRKQILSSIDCVLTAFPNCYPVIWVWCKIIAPMLKDSEPRNRDLAMEYFCAKVFRNLKGFDKSSCAEHFMPWIILRTILSTHSRLYLQSCFHRSLQKRMISANIITIVESHLLTSNSTEAWVLLNFITGSELKCTEPDSLIYQFVSLDKWNKEQNTLIALEVLTNCINDFSYTALNYAFTHIMKNIREGLIMPAFIGKSFDFLLAIDNLSNPSKGTNIDMPWLLELHEHLEYCILLGIPEFPDNRHTFISHLYSYSEVNLQTRKIPKQTIIKFLHNYISKCISMTEDDLDFDNQRVFNSMLVIAGRLSLRDATVARITCHQYGLILRKIDRPPIVNTIIVAITDLCKKHTQIIEGIMDHILKKLSSSFSMNRLETFKCFEKLVLQDQLKLRGNLLICLLSTILDDCEELAKHSQAFFNEILMKKNPTLFQQCLLQCPFVFNEYTNVNCLDSLLETAVQSPLKGASKRLERQLLYSYFIGNIPDANLIFYFGQLKLIRDKSQRDPLIKDECGIELIKDFLFILRQICKKTKEHKCDVNRDGNGDIDLAKDDELMENMNEMANEPSANPNNTKPATKTGNGPGRGRKRREITMAEALMVLEKSISDIAEIYKLTNDLDESLQKYFDDLCKALIKRFPIYIEYAQPSVFWEKYLPSKNTIDSSKQNSRKRKLNDALEQDNEKDEGVEIENQRAQNEATDENCVEGTEEDSNQSRDDNSIFDLNGIPNNSRMKNLRKSLPTDIHIEYLFKPNM